MSYLCADFNEEDCSGIVFTSKNSHDKEQLMEQQKIAIQELASCLNDFSVHILSDSHENVLEIFRGYATSDVTKKTVRLFTLNNILNTHTKKCLSQKNLNVLNEMVKKRRGSTAEQQQAEIHINEILMYIFFQWKHELVHTIHMCNALKQQNYNEDDTGLLEKKWGDIRAAITRNFPASWRNKADEFKDEYDHPLDPILHTPRSIIRNPSSFR